MRARLSVILPTVLVLAACAPQVSDSTRGSAFTSPEAIQARDAALQGVPLETTDTGLPPLDSTGAPVAGAVPVAGSAEQTAADTTRILQQTSTTATAQPVPPSVSNTIGISNENNFDAVSEQRSIESDAERIAQNRAQYQVIQPEALPERTGDDQPNIVAFALATSHPVGTRVYARAGLNGAARAARNCAQYPSPDRAQLDFLARGGPKRDRKGLDPDGDGYACSWDPTPFRSAAQG